MNAVDQKESKVDGKELLRQYRATEKREAELWSNVCSLRKQVRTSGEDYHAFCKAQTELQAAEKEYRTARQETGALLQQLKETCGCN